MGQEQRDLFPVIPSFSKEPVQQNRGLSAICISALKSPSLASLTDHSTPESCLASTVFSEILCITARHMQVGILSVHEIKLNSRNLPFGLKKTPLPQYYDSQLLCCQIYFRQ